MPDDDLNTPSIARVYDYLLGGSDNYPADQAAGERLIAVFPAVVSAARENRQFLARAVTWAAHRGISQFIDLGCGMPTIPNTHHSAQAVRPGARVRYVERDAVALARLRQVAAPGVSVVAGDLGDPGALGGDLWAGLDPAAPTCLILGLVLHFYPLARATALVTSYSAALAAGSYLVISMAHGNGEEGERWFSAYTAGTARARNYSVAEIGALFAGTELVPPGVVDVRQWQPGGPPQPALPFRTGQAIGGVGLIS